MFPPCSFHICRRLFPGPMVSLKGLLQNQDYTLTLRVASADVFRYKFVNMKWTTVGESEINQNEAKQLYTHPSSPNSGAFWMKKPISFRAIKISHSPNSRNGNVSGRNSIGQMLPLYGPKNCASWYNNMFHTRASIQK